MIEILGLLKGRRDRRWQGLTSPLRGEVGGKAGGDDRPGGDKFPPGI